LCIADMDGHFRRMNPAWEQTLGYSINELEGRKFVDLVHPDDLESTNHIVAELAQGGTVVDFVNRYRCRDGSYRWIEWRSSPSGEGLIYAAARDITERINAEEERRKLESHLRQAQKMEAIGTLAGGIAHDFNNVLFAILGNAELVLDELISGTSAYENMTQLIAAGNRAKGLVRQILAFSRKTQPEAVPLNLETIVKEVVKLLRATLPSTVEVRQHLEIVTRSIIADPTEVHQVVMNLCTNAAQAMEGQPGLLDISVSELEVDAEFAAQHLGLQPGPHLRLSVYDTGRGMSVEVRERIFEPFFTTKDLGKGTGMGLAVVHGIVTKLGGAISVYSEPGAGTTFHVYLPAASQPRVVEGSSVSSLHGGTERVLLVDDEPDIVHITERILSKLGYSVIACTSSEEALELFMRNPQAVDVVITDQTMPRLTGAELARKLLDVRPELPVILCTGFSQAVTPDMAKDLGISEYLYKPILQSSLAEALRRVLDQPQLG
jgi:PAS domain S-box-containing protein